MPLSQLCCTQLKSCDSCVRDRRNLIQISDHTINCINLKKTKGFLMVMLDRTGNMLRILTVHLRPRCIRVHELTSPLAEEYVHAVTNWPS
jgi:hypothetical protein